MPRRTASPRWYRSAWFAIPVSLLVGLALAEIVLRVLLFSDSAFVQRFAGDLRQAGNFASSTQDDDYWKLRRLFTAPERRVPCNGFDPLVGWTGESIEPGTYRPIEEQPADARRLVLLYGDSYAACVTTRAHRFPALLERSSLGARYRMQNYGVGGYGLDQVYLLLLHSIDQYRDRKPIVIVGVLVDNALDRVVLSVRDWPKPRLRLVDGRLQSDGPVVESFDTYLERHPLAIDSYLVRYVLHGTHLVPGRWRERWKDDPVVFAEKQSIDRELVAEIHRELESRGLEHFFLLFHSREDLCRTGSVTWQEKLVRAVCAETGARVISTRPHLSAANGGSTTTPERLYFDSGPGIGHMTAAGNAAAFEAMCDGIEGRAEPERGASLRDPFERGEFAGIARVTTEQTLLGSPAHVITDGAKNVVRASDSHAPPFERWSDASRVCFAPGEIGPTRVEIDLAPGVQRLRADVRAAIYPASDGAEHRLVLRIETDGRVAFREELAIGGDPRRLDLDLSGVRRLALVTVPVGSTPANAWVCFSDPKFE